MTPGTRVVCPDGCAGRVLGVDRGEAFVMRDGDGLHVHACIWYKIEQLREAKGEK